MPDSKPDSFNQAAGDRRLRLRLLAGRVLRLDLLSIAICVVMTGGALISRVHQPARNSPAQPSSPSAAFDVLQSSYAKFTDPTDPLAFPLKVERLTSSPYKFWRGAKDLFFKEIADDDRDWFVDRSTFKPSHGDIHASNIGTYAIDGKLGELAFGLVDFDDAAPLPPQVDLLEAIVSLKLAMSESTTTFAAADESAAIDKLFDAYSAGLRSDASAAQLLAEDPLVSKMLKRSKHVDYEDELKKLVHDDQFIVKGNAKGDVIRRQPRESFDDFAAAIADGISSCAHPERFRYHSPADWRGAMRDVVQRISLGSAGSQGLAKYFVLVDSPLLDGSQPQMVLYLKQQIPSAAARQKVAADEPSPAVRTRDCIAALTQPHPWLNAAATLRDGRTFLLTIKEPWSETLSDNAIADRDEAIALANRYGIALGVAHRNAGHPREWFKADDAAQRNDFEHRADTCVARVNADYAAFCADVRVAPLRDRARAALRELR